MEPVGYHPENYAAYRPSSSSHTGKPTHSSLSLSTHQDSPRTCLDRYSSPPPEPFNRFIPAGKWPSSQWNSKAELLPFWLVFSQPTNHATDWTVSSAGSEDVFRPKHPTFAGSPLRFVMSRREATDYSQFFYPFCSFHPHSITSEWNSWQPPISSLTEMDKYIQQLSWIKQYWTGSWKFNSGIIGPSQGNTRLRTECPPGVTVLDIWNVTV